jgi:hypothetical protein
MAPGQPAISLARQHFSNYRSLSEFPTASRRAGIFRGIHLGVSAKEDSRVAFGAPAGGR